MLKNGVDALGARIRNLTTQAFGQDQKVKELQASNLTLSEENGALIEHLAQQNGVIQGLRVHAVDLEQKLANGYCANALDRAKVNQLDALLSQQNTTILELDAQLGEAEENVRILLKEREIRDAQLKEAPMSYDAAVAASKPVAAKAPQVPPRPSKAATPAVVPAAIPTAGTVTGHSVTTYYAAPKPATVEAFGGIEINAASSDEEMEVDELAIQAAQLVSLQTEAKRKRDVEAQQEKDRLAALGQGAKADVKKAVKAAKEAEKKAMDMAIAYSQAHLEELAKLVMKNELNKAQINAMDIPQIAKEASLATLPSFSSAKEALEYFDRLQNAADSQYFKGYNEALEKLKPFGKDRSDVSAAMKGWIPPALNHVVWAPPKPAPAPKPAPEPAPVQAPAPTVVVVQKPVTVVVSNPDPVVVQKPRPPQRDGAQGIVPLSEQSNADVERDAVPFQKSADGVKWVNFKQFSEIEGNTRDIMLELYADYKSEMRRYAEASHAPFPQDGYKDIFYDNSLNVINFISQQKNYYIQRAALEAFWPKRPGEPLAVAHARQAKYEDHLKLALPEFLLETIGLSRFV